MKRKLYYVIVMVSIMFFTSACSEEVNMNLDYIKEPDTIVINSVDKLNELGELGDKLPEINENSSEKDKKEYLEIMDEIRKLQHEAKVKVTDKSTIHELTNDIMSTKGPYLKKKSISSEDLMFKIDFEYDILNGKIKNDNLANYYKEGYMLTFMVFKDETIGIYVYSKDAERNLEIIQLNADSEVINRIKRLYNGTNGN